MLYKGINNVEKWAVENRLDNPYWVIRDCGEHGYWYYGAYDTMEKARQAASEIGNGFVEHMGED